MITRKDFLEYTRNLKPVASHTSGLVWSEDYFKNGSLLRYSGLVDSDWVEVTDMLSEDNITRNREESLEDIMVWADGTWAYREEMYMMQDMSDDYRTLYVGSEEYESFCITNELY